MRKKLSPAVIVICLFAMTAGVLCVMFFMQNTVMKRVYGNEIRKDIFRINDLTETVMSELSALTADGGADTDGDKALPDAAALLFAAGELERCDLGGRIHELYDGLRKDTIQTVRDYAAASLKNSGSDLSAEAAARLAESAFAAAKQLRGATQFLMSELNDSDTDKMDSAYYRAMDVDAKIYKRLTTYINMNAEAAQ